ncbi:uncharacterized protein LOC116660916 [Camelus ferus]|uniref:Uncharacterized protein LOC116660916 n=1 Tax=Camelus ferus TaxID=419612 RepID=A0A8B8SB07_CAMFR|nr:uncharacterized protein LOC116660916 [Camelus ferus]XP_032327403.1 uncharacterized protein LOC116660916 [Camelus ferus]
MHFFNSKRNLCAIAANGKRHYLCETSGEHEQKRDGNKTAPSPAARGGGGGSGPALGSLWTAGEPLWDGVTGVPREPGRSLPRRGSQAVQGTRQHPGSGSAHLRDRVGPVTVPQLSLSPSLPLSLPSPQTWRNRESVRIAPWPSVGWGSPKASSAAPRVPSEADLPTTPCTHKDDTPFHTSGPSPSAFLPPPRASRITSQTRVLSQRPQQGGGQSRQDLKVDIPSPHPSFLEGCSGGRGTACQPLRTQRSSLDHRAAQPSPEVRPLPGRCPWKCFSHSRFLAQAGFPWLEPQEGVWLDSPQTCVWLNLLKQ